ncbi:MAG: CAP domain-containing protein [Polyangiales bacterium]
MPRTSRRAALALALVAASLAGCPSRTAGGDARSLPPRAPRYAQRAEAQPVTAPLPEVARAIADEARAVGVSALHDPALSDVARAVASRVASDPRRRPPSARTVQSLAWLAGVTDPVPTVITVSGPTTLSDAARASLREVFTQDRPNRFGVARVGDGDSGVTAVLLTQRRATMAPITRAVSVGGSLELRGRLDEGLRAPELVVTRPDGRNVERSLGAGPEFATRLALDARGAWQVEITAEGSLGATVVANFPVYVDVPPPSAPPSDDASEDLDPPAVERALFELANEARRANDVPPLTAMPALAEVARAHAVDMAEHRFVAHTSPTRGTTADRLERAGLRSGLALENVARGYGVRDIHDSLMASPGHRANLLNPTVTHVGIGVAREAGGSGALLVTQEFVEVARPLDPRQAAEALVASVNRARADQRLPPLERRDGLDAVAHSAATRFFADPSVPQDEVLSSAARELRAQSEAYRRVGMAAAFGPRLEGAERIDALLAPEMRAVGVGVSQGDRPGSPPNSIFVVWVVAAPR